MKRKGTGYEINPILSKLFNDLVRLGIPELHVVPHFQYSVLFTEKETSDHYGGKTKRVEGSIRYKTGIDFMILINKPNYVGATIEEKARIALHELYHIDEENGKPRIRRHYDDFCELPNHDKFSRDLYERVKDRIKVPTSFGEYGGYELKDGVRVYS